MILYDILLKNNLAQMFLNLQFVNYWNWSLKQQNLENQKNQPMDEELELQWMFLVRDLLKELEEIIGLQNVLQQNVH